MITDIVTKIALYKGRPTGDEALAIIKNAKRISSRAIELGLARVGARPATKHELDGHGKGTKRP